VQEAADRLLKAARSLTQWLAPKADEQELLASTADLLRSYLPLSVAILALREVYPDSPRLSEVHASLLQGSPLSRALADAKVVQDPTALALLAAGEHSGALADAVMRAAEELALRRRLQLELRSALAYPAFLFVVALGALAFLLGTVLPRFVQITNDLGVALPPSTRALLTLRQILIGLALLLLISACAWVLSLLRLSASERRTHIERLVIRLPFVGTLCRHLASARFGMSVSALIASGAPLDASIGYGIRATGSAECEDAASAIRRDLDEGVRLSVALSRLSLISPTTRRLVGLAEETGTLAPMLARSAEMERAAALRLVQRVARVAEPAVVLGVGCLVAITASAVLGSLYSLRPS
jgi:type II secretory pathway component PulF